MARSSDRWIVLLVLTVLSGCSAESDDAVREVKGELGPVSTPEKGTAEDVENHTLQAKGSEPETQSAGDPYWQAFPLLPPIADADPSVRHAVTVKVPTKLDNHRTHNTLSVTVDGNSLESTSVMVGSKMVTGIESKAFVYAEGDARPSEYTLTRAGGLDFNLGTSIRNTKLGGIPAPGKRYIVEMELSIFETDIPPQHMWSPYGKNFRILWKRTLTETVE